jgi:hypothetical protein
VLKNVEVEVFNLFVHCLYTQRVPKNVSEFISVTEDKASQADDGLLLLLKACVFGDRFLVPAFMTVTHHDYVDDVCCNMYPIEHEQITYGFQHLASNSPILTMMVEIECLRGYTPWANELGEDEEEGERLSALPLKFLARVMHRHRKLRQRQQPLGEDDVDAREYRLPSEDDEGEEAQEQEQEQEAFSDEWPALADGWPTTGEGW